MVGAKWQIRVGLFLKANWMSVWRSKHRKEKSLSLSLTSRLSTVRCIFYELADPSRSSRRPGVVMVVGCQAPLPRTPPSSVLMKLTRPLVEDEFYLNLIFEKKKNTELTFDTAVFFFF